MGFEFESFDRKAAGVSPHPYVTIQRKGPFSFNRAAYKLLGEPEAVELLFDKRQRVIGFRPISPEKAKAFPVRAQGKNAANFMVAGQSFAQHYELDTSVARRYPVYLDEGILILDLNGESVVVTGPRTVKDREDGGE